MCPSIFLSLDRIFAQVAERHRVSGLVINIGANDGVSGDPLYPVLQKFPKIHYLGVEVREFYEALTKNLRQFENVALVQESISPSTARSILSVHTKNKGLKPPDIIKIDTDGCDCHLLREILSDVYFRAKVIQIELNHIIPPPIAYEEMCQDDVYGRASGHLVNLDVWGCSMQAAWNIVRNYGYVLLQYDWPDAVFIQRAYLDVFPCVASSGNSFESNYWKGFYHAKKYKMASTHHKPDICGLHYKLALRSHLHPTTTIEHIITTQSSMDERSTLIEIEVNGIRADIRRRGNEPIRVTWHN